MQGSNTSTIDARLRGVPGFLTAWTYGTTGESTSVVAVLDTGTTLHPELTGRFLPGYDFVSDWDPVTQRGYANDGDGRDADAGDPGDWVDAADHSADPARYGDCEVEASSWHGTVIAGMLAGITNNGAGGAAMNWNGLVLPVRVAGKCGADVADIVDGMRWAAGLSACKTSDGAGGCAEFAPTNPNPARIVNNAAVLMGARRANARDETRTESWFLPHMERRFEPASPSGLRTRRSTMRISLRLFGPGRQAQSRSPWRSRAGIEIG